MNKRIDFSLLVVIVLLTLLGVLMVFSSSFYYSLNRWNDLFRFSSKGAVLAAVGIIIMLVTARVDYRRFEKWSIPILIISFVLLCVVLTKFGVPYNGAKRWINLGFTTLMPSEVAKFGLVIFFARLIKHNQKNMNKLSTILMFCVLIGIYAGLIVLQPNYSTALIISISLFVLLFLGGAKLSHLSLMGLVGLVGAFFIAMIKSYRIKRIMAFLNPTMDQMGDNYQVMHSLFALGSGGIFGVGLGQSTQNKLYIPEPQNDFIFSTIGEELGLIGTLFVLVLFITLIWRGYRAAIKCPDLFGSLTAAGIITMITVQMMVNICVTTKLIPVTGVPLPFISSGGSSLVVLLFQMGILLNISKST